MKKYIHYRDGYKYQLAEPYMQNIGIKPPNEIGNEYVLLYPDGMIMISKSYAWDGPSGPCPDWPSVMRFSLIHDALYQLMREEMLPQSFRYAADCLALKLPREDGLPWALCQVVYHAVRFGGGPSANPKHDRKVITAPKG